MLLRNLPDLLYNFGPSSVDPKFLVTKNIWRRAEILREYKNSVVVFDEYTVMNGEKPEDIALKEYNNPFYNWTVLVINDITNFHEQFSRLAFAPSGPGLQPLRGRTAAALDQGHESLFLTL